MAGVPRVASRATVPHPPAHCYAGGTLSVSVCVAQPQPRQPWPSFRVPGPGTLALQGEKCTPRLRLGTACLHLVLRSLPGASGQHRPRVEIRPVHPYAAFRSAPPWVAFSLSAVSAMRPTCVACLCCAFLVCCCRAQRFALYRRILCR